MTISFEPPLETDIDMELARGCIAPNNAVLPQDVLVAIAAGLAEVSPPWDLRPGDSPAERHYERILATELYEAWLIYWPPGTGLDLHDHGDSAGAFAVVDGALDETAIGDGRVDTRRLVEGETSSFAAGQVHGVANSGHRSATSVHVYSPPIVAMNY